MCKDTCFQLTFLAGLARVFEPKLTVLLMQEVEEKQKSGAAYFAASKPACFAGELDFTSA